jgi:Zn/Cd-binding protein ZinT
MSWSICFQEPIIQNRTLKKERLFSIQIEDSEYIGFQRLFGNWHSSYPYIQYQEMATFSMKKWPLYRATCFQYKQRNLNLGFQRLFGNWNSSYPYIQYQEMERLFSMQREESESRIPKALWQLTQHTFSIKKWWQEKPISLRSLPW